MSKVVTSVLLLEEQLRADGYKGTMRALRILKQLRLALAKAGYAFPTGKSARPKSSGKK